MAIPLIAGIPLLGKALTALKGGSALKAAAGFGANLGKGKIAATAAKLGGMPGTGAAAKVAAKSATQRATDIAKDLGIKEMRDRVRDVGGNGISFGGIKRWAGDALKGYMGPEGVTAGNLAINFGPDAFFGVLAGATTPGDLGDKLIAGSTAAVGGAMGGVAGYGIIPGAKTNPGMRMLAEFGGGFGGDMVGQAVGDTILRAKGGGLTPWERQGMEADAQYQQQIVDQFMLQNGLG